MKKKVSIEGMSCGHCVNHTREALSELNGVTQVEVSLEGKYAIVEACEDVSDDTIKAAVEEVGYEVVGIEEA
ncbi:cation transporter [Desulfitobacterium sp. THU1]|uniref:heavy-metal-associated domain-containing protein n=1 Tax=Desulfitobacterium sp. THU1 TaxID=3138072 RepID=UPI00311F8277